VRALIDDVLDRTVLGGYTRLGYRVRSRGWNDTDLGSMEGRVVLVTGATSGLGTAAAQGFARLGATVWLVARNRDRAKQSRDRIVAATGNDDVHIGVCDLSRLESVRSFVAQFVGGSPRLDVLVNNAGVLPHERELSVDGMELAFATNVVGPFLLTQLLVPLLTESAPARVVNVSSGGMYTQKVRVDDLQTAHGDFDGPRVYARTKRAGVILTEMWAEQLDGTGVVVHAMHPGWSDTPGIQSSLPRFRRLMRPLLRTPEEGADTIVWLGVAAEPASTTGRFWHDRRERPTHLIPWTHESPQERTRLWDECVRLTQQG
jgi:dehydrogenase/reductase SDR family member 12